MSLIDSGCKYRGFDRGIQPSCTNPPSIKNSHIEPCVGLCSIKHINSHIRKKVEHDHSGGVIPGPISNPEVKTSCVDSCTVVREPTGTIVVVPSSFRPSLAMFKSPHKYLFKYTLKRESRGEITWEFLLATFWDTVK